MEVKKRHYLNFDIAGFSYWEGCEVFSKLKMGTQLRFEREDNKKFDPYAVAIYYKEFKLGYIPRGENNHISKFLELGHTHLFEVRINRLTPDVHTEHQVGVIVYILPSDN